MFPVRLGLKASCDPIQVASRLTYQPEIFEFYTSEHDFTPQGLKMGFQISFPLAILILTKSCCKKATRWLTIFLMPSFS